jgi:hypothetical protein
MRASLSLTDEAKQALAAKDRATAANLVEDALKAWPQNEDALYIKQSLAAAKADPSATPKPATREKTQASGESISTATGSETVVEDKPFFMTVKGALVIVVAVLGILGGITLLGRLQKPKKKSE